MKKYYIKNILVFNTSSIETALKKLKATGVRCLLVTDKKNFFLGTCTDGDIRKKILSGYNIKSKINDVYNRNSIYFKKNSYTLFDIEKQFKKQIDLIPVLDSGHKVSDVILRSNYKKKINKKLNINKKQAVLIMAGGLGTRLKPFTDILPKSLIPINGKPIISLIINNFKNNGFKKIYISINKNDFIIKSYFASIKDKSVHFIEEEGPLGPLGSLSKIKNLKYDWFVTNCDTLFNFDISKLIKEHTQKKSDCTIVVSKQNHISKYGHCKLDYNNNILEIEEKPKNNYYLNVGIYLISWKILKLVPKNKYFTIIDLLNILRLKKISAKTYLIKKNMWSDLGNWDDYKKNSLKLNKYV